MKKFAKQIDFVLIVEHKDRELLFVREIRDNLISKGYSCIILSYYFDLWKLIFIRTKVLMLPFCINDKELPVRFFNRRRPIVINLNYEQYLSNINIQYKKPMCAFTQKEVIQCSWSEDFDDFLTSSNVVSYNILRTPSNFINQLFLEHTNSEMILDAQDTLVFLPLNFAWAFASDKTIQAKIKNGYPKDSAYEYRKFAIRHLKLFIKDLLNVAGANPDKQFLVRPHPTVSSEDYFTFISELGLTIPKNLKIHRQETAQFWLLRCNLVISNESTILLEAKNLRLPYQRVNYLRYPEFLKCDWHNSVVTSDKISLNNISLKKFHQVLNTKNEQENVTISEFVDNLISRTSENEYIPINYDLALIKYCLLAFLRSGYCIFRPRSSLAYDKLRQ